VSPELPRSRHGERGACRRAGLSHPGDDARQDHAHEAPEPVDWPAGPRPRGRAVSRPAPLAPTTVGVVVERRKAKSAWAEHIWRPGAGLAGAPATPPWTVLEGDDDSARFYAGSAELGLYRADTAQYRDNLASGSPGLWVVLRPTGSEPPYTIAAVT